MTARDLLVHELRDSKVYACSNTDVGEVLFYDVIFWDQKQLLSEINRVSFGGTLKVWWSV